MVIIEMRKFSLFFARRLRTPLSSSSFEIITVVAEPALYLLDEIVIYEEDDPQTRGAAGQRCRPQPQRSTGRTGNEQVRKDDT